MNPSFLLPESQVVEFRESLNALASAIQSPELKDALNKLKSMTSNPIDLSHLFAARNFRLPR